MAAKVVFPAPPLTTNNLTAQQRTQLVRKARKIEQLLGSTPHLIDTSITSAPINVMFSPGPSQRRLAKSSFTSFDSTSSSSSSSSFSSLARTTSFSSRLSSLGHKLGATSATSLNLKEAWPCDTKAPILRLPVESLSTAALGSFIHDFDNEVVLNADHPLNPCALTPPIAADISPHDSATVSISTTPSPNSLRKQKMDRLRRILGSCVPLDLVFPDITKDTPHPSTGSGMLNSTQQRRTIPSQQQSKTAVGAARFTEARDSVMSLSDAIAASVALARNQNQNQSLGSSASPPKHNVRQKRPRSAPAAEFRLKERLSLIMESPEENRLSCSDDRSRELGDSESNPTNPTGIEAANQTSCPPQLVKRPVTAPASISTSKNWESSGDAPPAMERTLKRRPSSYRKPPPPLPTDLDC